MRVEKLMRDNSNVYLVHVTFPEALKEQKTCYLLYLYCVAKCMGEHKGNIQQLGNFYRFGSSSFDSVVEIYRAESSIAASHNLKCSQQLKTENLTVEAMEILFKAK